MGEQITDNPMNNQVHENDFPLFSVIVPAYNSAAYIRKLLDSIKTQTFTDYELIVVCDSCADNTAAIAREYTDHVHEVNFGRDGLTRNYGLDHATGRWVLFADDDDWFLHEFVFEMIAGLIGKNDEDMLFFGFIWKGMGYARNTKDNIFIACWSKCWRRSFIGDTRFSDVKYVSDADFHREMMLKRPRALFWDMPFYYYNYMRDGSQSDEQHKLGLI